MTHLIITAVPDPDLEIRWGEGGAHPDPYIGGGGGVLPKNFSALWASVWSKNKGAAPPGPSLDLPLCSTIILLSQNPSVKIWSNNFQIVMTNFSKLCACLNANLMTEFYVN